jgi:uncharacterized surface protein with fasciclin (FAS1) repeats
MPNHLSIKSNAVDWATRQSRIASILHNSKTRRNKGIIMEATQSQTTSTLGLHDIVDTAQAAGSFNTLTNALKAAGLVETLKGTGPFTVYAPTDEAFAKLPAGTVESLLKDKEKLAGILKYHVMPGKLMIKDIKSGDLDTVQGSKVKVVVNNDQISVGAAKITKKDIETSNGVIHAIDTVVMPA